MSIALVSTATAATAGTAVSTISTAAFNCVAGNFLYVGLEIDSSVTTGSAPSVISSISDTAGNNLTFLASLTRSSGTGLAVYGKWNCLGNATNVMELQTSTSVQYTGFTARQYSGVQTTGNPLDQKATGTSSSSVSSITSGTLTPSVAGTVGIALAASDGNQTYTVGTGFGNLDIPNSSGINICAIEDQLNLPVSSQTATINGSGSQTNWAILFTTFLPVQGGGSFGFLGLMGCGA